MFRLLGIAAAALLFAGSAFAFAPSDTLDPERPVRDAITSRSAMQFAQVIYCWERRGCRYLRSCKLDVDRRSFTCNPRRMPDGSCRQWANNQYNTVPCGKVRRRA